MVRACLPLSLWRHQCTQLGVSQGATTFQRSSAHVTYGPQGAPRHPGWKPAPTTSPDLQGMLYRQRPQLIFVCASDRVVLISPGKAVGAGGEDISPITPASHRDIWDLQTHMRFTAPLSAPHSPVAKHSMCSMA